VRDDIKSLQALRAIAAASVVYFHIGNSPVFGSFGVDIFFVLSGFVMAMVVARGQSASMFAAHRISRIVPLYWLLTTCVLVVALVTPQLLNSTTANGWNYVRSLLFLPYFKENGALHPMLAVGWTLNYEMFFYLCVLLALLIDRQRCLLLTAALIVVAYFGLGQWSDGGVFNAFFANTLLFEFLLGMVAFRLYHRGVLARLPMFAALSTALGCYVFMALAESHAVDETNRLLWYGLPALLLLLAALRLESLSLRGLQPLMTLLVALGNASYATYLSHFYVVEGVRKLIHPHFGVMNPDTLSGALAIMLVALLVGQFLYISVDKPLSGYVKRKLSAAGAAVRGKVAYSTPS